MIVASAVCLSTTTLSQVQFMYQLSLKHESGRTLWLILKTSIIATGGKGSITQWVHAEYMEGSETIHPTFTQWVRGGYFSKVPTKVPTG